MIARHLLQQRSAFERKAVERLRLSTREELEVLRLDIEPATLECGFHRYDVVARPRDVFDRLIRYSHAWNAKCVEERVHRLTVNIHPFDRLACHLRDHLRHLPKGHAIGTCDVEDSL